MISRHQHLEARFVQDKHGIWRRRFQKRELADTIDSFFARTRFAQQRSLYGTACLIWQGARDKRGYGVLSVAGKRLLAHRVAFVMAYGKIPKPLVRHLCDNTSCVNPLHLAAGTALDNHNDAKKANRTAKGESSGRYKHPEAYPVGDACPNSKLTSIAVMEIHRLYRTRLKDTVELSIDYGVSVTTINSALHGRSWNIEFEAARQIYPSMEMHHRKNLGKKRWKFDAAKAAQIRAKKEAGMSVNSIANEFVLSVSSIYKALRMYPKDK